MWFKNIKNKWNFAFNSYEYLIAVSKIKKNILMTEVGFRIK